MAQESTDPLAEIDRILNTCLNCRRDKKDASTPPCYFCKPLPKYPAHAPDGQIFVCGACGRTSKCIAGHRGSSWDESCMMNAVLCHESSIERDGCGRISKASAVEGY